MTSFLIQTAQATSYFSWNAEGLSGSNAPLWGSRGAYTGAASLRSQSSIDCSVRHSGSCSLKVRPTGIGTNESTGIDLNNIPPAYPFNYIGSQLYYRWWMRIDAGFSWGDNSSGWTKVGRAMTPDMSGAYYTGMTNPYFQLSSSVTAGGNIYLDDFSTDDVFNSSIGTKPPPTSLKAPANLRIVL